MSARNLSQAKPSKQIHITQGEDRNVAPQIEIKGNWTLLEISAIARLISLAFRKHNASKRDHHLVAKTNMQGDKL